jgi:hypothetical protein
MLFLSFQGVAQLLASTSIMRRRLLGALVHVSTPILEHHAVKNSTTRQSERMQSVYALAGFIRKAFLFSPTSHLTGLRTSCVRTVLKA